MKKRMRRELPPPCRNCTRVRNPVACDNKECQVWRQWFVERWDQMRTYPRRAMDQTAPVGIRIGGEFYPHPDHIRQYLRHDPCQGCKCPEELCKAPCRFKINWENRIEEEKNELEK